MTRMNRVDLDSQLRSLEGHLAQNDAGDRLLDPRNTWNLSQTLQHCAQSITYSVTGYPQLKSVLIRATVGRIAKRIFLARGAMRHDLSAPLPGAPALDENLPVSDAAQRLRTAVETFQKFSGDPAPHPAYGRCSHADYTRLHAMHIAEHAPGLLTS